MSRNRLLDIALVSLVLSVCMLVYFGCEQTDPPEPDKNAAPDTEITIGPSEEGSNYYRVHLFWKGFDEDGLIRGFEYAIGDTLRVDEWSFTAKSDSEFVFPTATDDEQSQVADHLFSIRAIDNEGKEDRTPAFVAFETFSTVEPRSIILREVAFCMVGDGNELYVGAGENGLDIYDVSDPNDIQRKRTVFTGGNATSLLKKDGYVYLADGLPGVSVIDVQNPDEAEVVGSYQTLGRSAMGIANEDNYLFVADGTNGLVVLDITIPEEPVFFARFRPDSTFVSVVVDDGMVYAGVENVGIYSLQFDPASSGFALAPVSGVHLYEIDHPRAMFVQDDRLLVAAGDEGLLILDIGAGGNLSSGSQFVTNGFAVDVDANDDYAFLADGFNGLVSVDISNPSVPELGSILDFSGDVTGVKLDGDSLYLGNNDRGIAVVDISDPTALSLAIKPVLRFCEELVPVGGGEFDTLRSPSERETLLAYSDVKFCWEGISDGGIVTGYRYQLQGVNVDPIVVGPESLSVIYRELPPRDLYEFAVDTKDETGLWSTGDASGSRKFTINFDPETTLDSIKYDPNLPGVDFIDITGEEEIRLEDSSTIFFWWSVDDRDIDIPNQALADSVIGSFWNVGGAGFFSPDSIETRRVFNGSAGPLTASPPGTPYVLEIGGIDSFGRRERDGATFEFEVNFPPVVAINSPQPNQDLPRSGEMITINLTVQDPDGPPNLVLLEYELELIEDAGRTQIAFPTEVLPPTVGLNGEAVDFEVEINLLGFRGIFEFQVTPLDRAGAGSQGTTQKVTFFVTS